MSLADTASFEDQAFENDVIESPPPIADIPEPPVKESNSSNYYSSSYQYSDENVSPCTCPTDFDPCSLSRSFYSSFLGPTADESILVGLQTFFGFAGNCDSDNPAGTPSGAFCCGGKCPGSACDVSQNCQKLIPCLKNANGKSNKCKPCQKGRERGCRTCVNRNLPTYVVNNVLGLDPGISPSHFTTHNNKSGMIPAQDVTPSKHLSQPEIEQGNINYPPRTSLTKTSKRNYIKKEASRLSRTIAEPSQSRVSPDVLADPAPLTPVKSQRFASDADPSQTASLSSPVRATSLKSYPDTISTNPNPSHSINVIPPTYQPSHISNVGPTYQPSHISNVGPTYQPSHISNIGPTYQPSHTANVVPSYQPSHITNIVPPSYQPSRMSNVVPPPHEPSHLHVEPSHGHISHHENSHLIKTAHSHAHQSHHGLATSPSRWTTATKVSTWHSDSPTDNQIVVPDEKPTRENQDVPVNNNCGCMNYSSPYCTCGFNSIPQMNNAPFQCCNDVHIFSNPMRDQNKNCVCLAAPPPISNSYTSNGFAAICKNCAKLLPFPNICPRFMPPQTPPICSCCKCLPIDNNNNGTNKKNNNINWCTCDNQISSPNQQNSNFCTCNNCPQVCKICQCGNVVSN